MFIDRLEIDKKRLPLRLLRRLDTRLRLAAGIGAIILSIQISNCLLLAALLALCLAVLFTNIRVILLRLIPVNLFALILFISLPAGAFLTARLQGAAPDYAGAFDMALIYTLRINIAALWYMIFIIPMGISALSAALASLRVPSKLITLLILTYRFISVMAERLFTAALSLRLRKSKTLPKLMEFRCYAALFAAAFISAELRAEKIMMAMEAKGFDGVFPLTTDLGGE